MSECVFCKIVSGDLPSEKLCEDDDFIVIKDIHPKAPVHDLVIARRHIVSVNELKKEDAGLAGKMILAARKMAEKEGLKDKGYKLIFNVGRGGGQAIDHIHLHLVGGWDGPRGEI